MRKKLPKSIRIHQKSLLALFLQYQSYEDENLAMVKNAFHIAPSIFRSLESLDVLTFDIEF